MLIVLQHDIIVRAVFFDQVTLQNERFKLGIRNNILKVVNMRNHRRNLRILLRFLTKIRADTIFQHQRLADVDHLSVLVAHDIYARRLRQIFYSLFQLFR